MTALEHGGEILGVVRNFPVNERAILEPQDILSILVLPIFAAGEWWGFIGFDDCITERKWLDVDKEMLRTATSLIGQALSREILHSKLRHRTGELNTIAEVGGLVAAGGEFQTVLDTLVRKISEATDFEAIGINLYQHETQLLTFTSFYSDETLDALRTRLDQTGGIEELPLLHEVIANKQYVLVRDLQNDARFKDKMLTVGQVEEVQTLIVWPLLFGGGLIGTLDLISWYVK